MMFVNSEGSARLDPESVALPCAAAAWLSGTWCVMPDTRDGGSAPTVIPADAYGQACLEPKTFDTRWTMKRVALVYRLPAAT